MMENHSSMTKRSRAELCQAERSTTERNMAERCKAQRRNNAQRHKDGFLWTTMEHHSSCMTGRSTAELRHAERSTSERHMAQRCQAQRRRATKRRRNANRRRNAKRRKMNEAAAVMQNTVMTMDHLPSEILSHGIFPFVGEQQYRFVGSVNQTFRQSYIAAFPSQITCYNVSTIQHAKICLADVRKFPAKKLGLYPPCTGPEILFRLAAKQRNWKVLHYLYNVQCDWEASTCSRAANSGHLDVLKWANKKGCPWDKSTCSAAAGGGHLDVLKWVRRQGCPWDGETCSHAAESGHLDVLKWAHENSCPWDKDTCSLAARNGHLNVLV
jgi:hypothetical protein